MTQEQKKEVILNNLRLTNNARLDVQNVNIHINNLYEYMVKSIPKKLYKYRECNEQNIDALKKKKIWFSSPNYWNDKADVTVVFDLIKDKNYIEKNFKEIVLKYGERLILNANNSAFNNLNEKEILKIKQMYSEYMDEQCGFDYEKLHAKLADLVGVNESNQIMSALIKIKNFYEKSEFKNQLEKGLDSFLKVNELKNNIYMCSLSESYCNDKQWADYAKNDCGYCVGYYIEPKNDFEKSLITELLPIIYGEKKAKSLIDWLFRVIESYEDISKPPMEFTEELYLELYTKNSCWSVEEEWRFRINGFGEFGALVDFDFAESIYLGENIKECWKAKLIKIAKIQGLKVYQRKFDKVQSMYDYEEILL